MRSPEAHIDRKTLTWARTTAGLDVEAAAKKLAVSPDTLRAWEEKGGKRPTVKQLRKAARLYHRPMCLFFLPSLPEDADSIRDFRRISGAVDLGLTPALRFEIRLARERREEALELARDLRQPPAGFAERASLDDDPEVLATRLRQRLGVSLADQTGWQSKYDGFNAWRAAIERLGALVFQTGATPSLRVEPNEARGFSIADKPFPVIVVNGGDPVTARSFTVIHELAHIVLRNGGVCDLHHTVSPRNEVDRVEVFCNRVAGAVLVPAEALRATGVVLHHGASVSWSDDEIGQLARRFWVSWEVVLRRLLIVGKTTKDFYDGWRNDRRDRYPERVDTGEPHLKMPVRVVRRHGRLFPKLVLDGYDEAVLTAHEAASYLNAGPEHLDAIRAEVFESKYAS
jgi:Zn-dependent peptidase ImmA (M78 family)